MFFVILIVLSLILIFAYLCRQKDNFKGSKTLLALVITNITVNINLAQNYTQSLIPNLSDGIGISNIIASWIITDEDWGRTWSIELFKRAYDLSSYILVLSVIFFVIALLRESRAKKQKNNF